MATHFDYMRGNKRAYLKQKNVQPKWMKSPPQILKLTNNAFKLYFIARNAIKKAPKEIRTELGVDLTNAAQSGSGYLLFPGDLEAVFQHIVDNNNHWVSDSGSNYCGPQIHGALNLPDGITNFLNAVDKRGVNLKTDFVKYTKYVEQLARAKKKNQWSEIGDVVGQIGKTLDRTSHIVWITSILSSKNSLTDYHSRFTKFNSGVGTVHSFLDTFNKYNVGVGTTKPQAFVIAGLTTAIKKFVPIVGDAYAKMFETLPNIIQWARNIRREEDEKIRQILGGGNW